MKLQEIYKAAYDFGKASQGKDINALAYGDTSQKFNDSTKTPALATFFDLGYAGKPLPEYVTGWRFGAIPESGISYNFRGNRPEKGLSIMAIDGEEPTDDAKLYAIFNHSKGDIVRVGGWLVGFGSDGEPLLILPHIIG